MATELLGIQSAVQELEKQLFWTRKVLNTLCYFIQEKFGREDDLPKEILRPEYIDAQRLRPDPDDDDDDVFRNESITTGTGPGTMTNPDPLQQAPIYMLPFVIAPQPQVPQDQPVHVHTSVPRKHIPKPISRHIQKTPRKTKPCPTPNQDAFPCDNCDQAFSSNDHLEAHRITQHRHCFIKIARLDNNDGQAESFTTFEEVKHVPIAGDYESEEDKESETEPMDVNDNDDFHPDSEDQSSSSSNSESENSGDEDDDDDEYIPKPHSENRKSRSKQGRRRRTSNWNSNRNYDTERPSTSYSAVRKPIACNIAQQSSRHLWKKERGTFYCNYCDYDTSTTNSFSRMHLLMLHKDSAHPEQFKEELKNNRIARKQLAFACTICPDTWFGRKVHCENHFAKFHPKEVSTQIPVEKTFDNEFIVSIDDGILKCRQCPKSKEFENPALLKMHQFKRHMKFPQGFRIFRGKPMPASKKAAILRSRGHLNQLGVSESAREVEKHEALDEEGSKSDFNPDSDANLNSCSEADEDDSSTNNTLRRPRGRPRKRASQSNAETDDSDTEGFFYATRKSMSCDLLSSKYLWKKERGTFYCNYCELNLTNSYSRMHLLMLHKDSVHSEQFAEELRKNRISRKQLAYACTICQDTYFGRKAHCAKHFAYFHPDEAESLIPREEIFDNEFIVSLDDGELKCQKCPESEATKFTNPAELKIHKLKGHVKASYKPKPRRKQSPKPNPITRNCQTCNKKFKSSIYYLEHLQAVHPPEYERAIETNVDLKLLSVELSTTFCKTCKVELGNEDELAAHNAQLHHFKCPHCSRVLRSPGILREHIRNVHDEGVEWTKHLCTICGATLKTDFSLRRHIEGSHGEAKFACHLCSYKGRLYALLNVHLESQHGIITSTKQRVPKGPQQCELCGEFIKSRSGMRSHLDSVHYGIRRWPCSLCDKSFKNNTHLKYHLKTHENPNSRKRSLNKERDPIRRKGRFGNYKNSQRININPLDEQNQSNEDNSNETESPSTSNNMNMILPN